MTAQTDVKTCEYCGKEFARRPDEHAYNFRLRQCCNRSCAAGLTNSKRSRQVILMGIYEIRHVASGKVYIGSSNNIRKRWNAHQTHLRNNVHCSNRLQRAWNKYGAEAFTFSVVEAVNDVAFLEEREQFWINQTGCCDPKYGYNWATVAGTTRGIHFDEDVRRRVSLGVKGKNAGSKQWLAKLDEGKVAVIKQRLADGETLRALADDYGVCVATIGLIRTGDIWQHVAGPQLSELDRRRLWLKNAKRGAENSQAKITEEQALEIKRRLAEGFRQNQIARELNISTTTVNRIAQGKTWKHVCLPSGYQPVSPKFGCLRGPDKIRRPHRRDKMAEYEQCCLPGLATS